MGHGIISQIEKTQNQIICILKDHYILIPFLSTYPHSIKPSFFYECQYTCERLKKYTQSVYMDRYKTLINPIHQTNKLNQTTPIKSNAGIYLPKSINTYTFVYIYITLI